MTERQPVHIPFLDHIRGVAIIAVLAFHTMVKALGVNQLPWHGWFRGSVDSSLFYLFFPATFGFLGVSLFFVVSGFCIHLSHERSREKGFNVFFLRRFFRVYPPYLLALLLIAYVFNRSPVFQEPGEVLTHVFLIHNYFESYFFGVINAPFWSIAVELQLYLLYPALLWITRRGGWIAALKLTCLFEIGLRSLEAIGVIFYPDWDVPLAFTGSPFHFWFSWTVGAALADAYLKGRPLPFRGSLGYVWAVLCIGAYFFKPAFVFMFPLAALATAYLISYLLSRPSQHFSTSRGWRVAMEILRAAGIVSYSAYLIHSPLLRKEGMYLAAYSQLHPLPSWAVLLIYLLSWLPIFGLSYLFYRLVEMPSIAWGKRIIQGLKTKPAGSCS